ncbi:hypothetical protein [Pseudaminobacter soli (ex Li et al. 2025)]|uniref:Uncharacterized protein n=1 Tax=Pseudaminobacter soli (ex Li et al. 2025) TaxID=1295366 RepID=A0A2P7S2F9_9HYPH|nr:hypothetical protein [Mesorhizobium soli]PSJ56657.1 hypothetical protein C7I85_24185 [Mesorhizobium soli]
MKKIADVFKPKPTTREFRGDTTTSAARQITEGEKVAREAKTERLRLARLAKEAAEPPMTTRKPNPGSVKERGVPAKKKPAGSGQI